MLGLTIMSKRKLAAGFALVESMVTIVVIAFGLLGVAGLVSRSFVTEAEANQRTQAQTAAAGHGRADGGQSRQCRHLRDR